MTARRMIFGAHTSPFVRESVPTSVAADGARVDVMIGSAYKAFPGMTLDPSTGWLHLVYRNGTAHNSGASSIDYKVSTDGGATWSTPGSAVVIVNSTGTDDLRDPNIVALASGRLLVTYDERNPFTGDDIHAFAIYSDDGGLTWSSPYEIPNSFSGACIVSAAPIELASGDILLPAFGENGGNYISVVFTSTDDGATFGSQTTIATGSHDWEEPVIRQLSSGTIVALMRDTVGSVTYRSASTDDGATWSAATSVLTGGGRPDFVEFYADCLFLILRGNNSTTTEARWTASFDAGLTWEALTEVDVGATEELEYSAPVVMSANHVTVVYSLETSGSDADLYLRRYVAS